MNKKYKSFFKNMYVFDNKRAEKIVMKSLLWLPEQMRKMEV